MFTQWDKRYVVLDQEKIMFYDDSSKAKLRKTLDLKTDVK